MNAAATLSAQAVLAALQAWRDAGLLRALDLAFVRFLHAQDAQAPASLLLAAAVLARLEGQGHACLPLATWPREPALALGLDTPWPAGLPEGPAAALLAGLPADADAARAAWAASPLLQVDPADDSGRSPLVLCEDRLALRRYWRHERRLAEGLSPRAQPGPPPPADRVRRALAALFPGAPDEPDAQRLACALSLRAGVTLITGGPGTGKTYTAARALLLHQALHDGPAPLRVALAAPTGKAAARLRESIGGALQALAEREESLAQAGVRLPAPEALPPACTLHALLGARPDTRRWARDAENPLALDLLFVDEASMVHLELMDALLQALPAGARLVLLGDRDQLASVEAGAVLAELCAGFEGYGPAVREWLEPLAGRAWPPGQAIDDDPADPLAAQTVVLHRSRRFDSAIGNLARAVNAGEGDAALRLLRDGRAQGLSLHRVAQPEHVLAAAVRAGDDTEARGWGGYVRTLFDERPAHAAGPAALQEWALRLMAQFEGFRVLCAVREGPWGVAGVNELVERVLAAQGPPRRGEWAEGRPVMVTRNEPALGVYNGDIGLTLPDADGALRVVFRDGPGRLRWLSPTRLAQVQTAWAMTVHKSQGSEFGHVALVLPEHDHAGLTREWLYTGLTRARQALTVIAANESLLHSACDRRTRRCSGLRPALRQALRR